MTYLDIGFDENLNRIDQTSGGVMDQSLSPQTFDNLTDQIPGSKIQGGVLRSPDGKFSLDLDQGIFIVKNGDQEIVRLGVLADGTLGLMIKDSQGNILGKVSENEFYFQSALKTSKLDLIADQYTVRDQFNNLKVLLGKDPGGF